MTRRAPCTRLRALLGRPSLSGRPGARHPAAAGCPAQRRGSRRRRRPRPLNEHQLQGGLRLGEQRLERQWPPEVRRGPPRVPFHRRQRHAPPAASAATVAWRDNRLHGRDAERVARVADDVVPVSRLCRALSDGATARGPRASARTTLAGEAGTSGRRTPTCRPRQDAAPRCASSRGNAPAPYSQESRLGARPAAIALQVHDSRFPVGVQGSGSGKSSMVHKDSRTMNREPVNREPGTL